MNKYYAPLVIILVGVIMLVAGWLDINYHYVGALESNAVLAIPAGAVFGSLFSIFQIWRNSSTQVTNDIFKNVAAASENLADAPSGDKPLQSPTPTEGEMEILACIVMDKGDSARLNDVERAFFIKVIREAKEKIESGHSNEFWTTVYVSERLKEFGSPALNVVAQFYVDRLTAN